MQRIALLALAAVVFVAPAAAAAPRTYGDRLGSHSMLYLNSRPEHQEALFRAAAESNLRYLRMDFALGLVFRRDGADFSAVDRIDALAARYRVRVLAVLTEIPWFIADCGTLPWTHMGRCPPARSHDATWREMVFRVARRARNVRHWQLGNEPDDVRTFVGTAGDYARWAALAADGIRAARPRARIASGGFSHLDRRFITAVLHDAANPLIRRIDIATVHARGQLRALRGAARRARAFFRRSGFAGPLWVTESGYPSRPEHQWDPALQGGEADQARWMHRGPRSLMAGGADVVFVAFRDSPELGAESPYASEGVVLWPQLARDGRAIPKPAYWALRAVAVGRLPGA